jgi:RecJ-like exonuclease
MSQLLKKAQEIANVLKEQNKVQIVTHIDADGISAGSLAAQTLKRQGIEFDIRFLKKLDDMEIKRLKKENHDLVWFTDFGSGALPMLSGLNCVICDHHVPAHGKISKKDRMNILNWTEIVEEDTTLQLNPHHFGLDGSFDISGAGTTYIVAKMMDKKNMDLSALAVVGAIGDLQDSKHLKLVGTNQDILKDAKSAKVISWKKDIRYFGRETRPVFKLLQYGNDPLIPNLTGKEDACINFLLELGIPLKDGETWRRWIDLSKVEKRLILSEIVKLLISKGFGHEITSRLIGDVYILQNEEEGTELRDAKEFATLLNSCGRYDKARIGYEVCLGDRGDALDRALLLLQGHRRTLVDMLHLIKEEGITELEFIQFFNGHDKVPENITGTLAGMLLGGEEVRLDLPMFGLALTSEGDIKVSARGTRTLITQGLDLSVVMKQSSERVGGVGGGHNIAAGATIPKGKEEEFLSLANNLIKKQLSEK